MGKACLFLYPPPNRDDLDGGHKNGIMGIACDRGRPLHGFLRHRHLQRLVRRKNGKEAYKSNIDLLDVVSSLKNERLTISYNAGTFICNEIYYNSLKYIYENNLNTKCVFIHIPFIETQVENRPNIPFVSLNDSINIITDIIKYVTKI